MNHSNMYAVGLALCTFANIASEEMSRDLCNEVEKLLGSSNTYVRKKVHFTYHFKLTCITEWFLQAALCALRIVRKVPELIDHFISKAKNLLSDRNHGVLLSGITLITEMCQADPSCLDEFRNVRRRLLILHVLGNAKNSVTLGCTPISPPSQVIGYDRI